jgi:hypothetical protein
MPCHPHPFTKPFAALPSTTSALLRKSSGRSAVVRREATRGIVADNLLTAATNSRTIRRTPVRVQRTMADSCSFCGSATGPFHKVGGLFTVLMCADCQAARATAAVPIQ